MEIEILKDESLTEKEKETLINFEVESFDTEKVRDFKRDRYFAPTYRHLLIKNEDHLVSYLRIVLRPAKWGDKMY